MLTSCLMILFLESWIVQLSAFSAAMAMKIIIMKFGNNENVEFKKIPIFANKHAITSGSRPAVIS